MTPLRLVYLFLGGMIGLFLSFVPYASAQHVASGTAGPVLRSVRRKVPDSCRVTKSSDRAFVPPYGYPMNAPKGYFWFGTDELWTMLPRNGAWIGLPRYSPNDPSFRQKMSWWRQGYDMRSEPSPKLKVTGRRLDAPAFPLRADRASNVSSSPAYIMTGVNLSSLGCWEITGHYDGHEVTFVVWVGL
jgi:hypothetical protein